MGVALLIVLGSAAIAAAAARGSHAVIPGDTLPVVPPRTDTFVVPARNVPCDVTPLRAGMRDAFEPAA